MNKKLLIIILCAVLIVAITAVILLMQGKPADTPADEDATDATAATVAETIASTQPATAAQTAAATEDNTESDTQADEELDFFETFVDYPAHFVAHGVNPGEEMSSEFYFHATMEIASDGKITGTYFNNLDSADGSTVEKVSNWTAAIRGNKVYLGDDGWYFYLDNVKYEKKPGTSEEKDGKTINYVYAYGSNEKADNKIQLFDPETPIDSFPSEEGGPDMRQFLSTMRKDGEGEMLGCFMIVGENDSRYVSITDEEAQMAAQGDERGEEPAPPEQPQQPEQPAPPQRPDAPQ